MTSEIIGVSPGECLIVPRVLDQQVSFGQFSVSPVNLTLVAPDTLRSVQAGEPWTLNFFVLDGTGANALPFTGIVHFSSSDPSADLPADVHVSAATGGYLNLSGLVLHVAGVQTVEATDAATGNVLYSAAYDVAPGPVAGLRSEGPPSVQAAQPWTLAVTAVDAYGNTVLDYDGIVTLATSDPRGTVAPPHLYDSNDVGLYMFAPLTLLTTGAQTVTATDPANVQLQSTLTLSVQPLPAETLQLSGAAAATAGQPYALMLAAFDAYGNPATQFTDTVVFTSDDPNAILPLPYPFTAADQGNAAFLATFLRAGPHTLSVQTIDGSLATTLSLTTEAAPLDHFLLTPVQSPRVAGTASQVSLQATDVYGNSVPQYRGTVQMQTSDPNGKVTPAQYTFSSDDAGVADFAVMLQSVGTWTLNASDIVTHVGVQQGNIAVTPAAAGGLRLRGLATNWVAGQAGTPTVQLVDIYGNVLTNYVGTVHFSSTDHNALLPPDTTFQVGDAGELSFPNAVKLVTAGTQSVTVRDTVNPLLAGTQTGLQVSASTASQLVFTRMPSTATTCAALTPPPTVGALDAYGNPVPLTTPVSLALSNATGSLTGQLELTPATNSNALAFQNVAVNPAGSAYHLLAQAAGLVTATSPAFSVVNVAPSVTVQSVTGTAGVIDVQYTVASACAVDLAVTYDPNAQGFFYNARAAAGSNGLSQVTVSPTGTTREFFWDSVYNLPGFAGTDVTLRVRAVGINGAGSATSSGLTVNNGLAYASPTITSTAQPSRCVALADINHDGCVDLVVGDMGSASLEVLLGDGAGNFATPTSITSAAVLNDLVLADINRDGNVDGVAVSTTGNKVNTLLGDGTGHFTSSATLSLTAPVALAITDFNRDGKLDALVAQAGGTPQVAFLQGAGDGTFSNVQNTALSAAPAAVAVGDLNRDGYADVVTCGAANLSLILGGAAGLAATPTTFAGTANPSSLVLADIDRNGTLDALVGDAAGSVKVYLGDGAGHLTAGPLSTVAAAPAALQVVDMDRDGWPDFVAGLSNGTVAVARGFGNGTFALPPITLSAGATVEDIALGDVDRDGRMDVVDGRAVAGITVHLNRYSAASSVDVWGPHWFASTGVISVAAAADFNEDGMMDVATADSSGTNVALQIFYGDGRGNLTYVTSWPVSPGPQKIIATDLDGDKHVDLAVSSNSSGTVSLLFGDGAGNFTPSTSPYVGGGPFGLGVADMNQDGRPDLVVALNLAQDVAVLTNQGRRQFVVSGLYSTIAVPRFLALGDINGDGLSDAAVGSLGTASVQIMLNDGSGGLVMGTTVAVSPRGTFFLADVNEDGHLDLVVDNFAVALGVGNGTFAAPASLGALAGFDLAMADYNGDGHLDFAQPGVYDDVNCIQFGDGTGSFTQRCSCGGGNSGVVAADLNGDGAADLLLMANGTRITTALNDGSGNFPAAPISFGATDPRAVALADINQDGYLDAAIDDLGVSSNGNTLTPGLFVEYDNGQGLFTLGSQFNATAATANPPVLADFDRNGWVDGAAADSTSSLVYVWDQNAVGSSNWQNFLAPQIVGANAPMNLKAVDFTGDGIVDLLFTSAADKNLYMAAGNANGTFAAPAALTANSAKSGYLAVGDLNHDGALDVVMSGINEVVAVLGNGSGGVLGSGIAQRAAISQPAGLALADMNRDGFLDVIVAARGGVGIILAISGTFTSAQLYATPMTPRSIAVDDINLDGIPDVAAGANSSGGPVSLLYGNADGSLRLISNLWTGGAKGAGPALGDVNRDGWPDLVLVDEHDAFQRRGSKILYFPALKQPSPPQPLLQHQASQLCVDTLGGRATTGIQPVLAACNANNPNQRWQIVGTALHVANTNACLNDHNGIHAAGAVVDVYPCSGSSAQKWLVYANAQTFAPIALAQTTFCLGTQAGSTAVGTPMVLQACSGGGQNFTLLWP